MTGIGENIVLRGVDEDEEEVVLVFDSVSLVQDDVSFPKTA